MQIILDRQLSDRLARLPESGMGYQIVDLMLRNGSMISDVLVLNAQIAKVPDDGRVANSAEIVDFRLHQG